MFWHRLVLSVTWIALLAMKVESSSGSQLPPIQGGPDPYNSAQEYNAFPWNFETSAAYILQVSPISGPPTNPPAYVGYPILPGFIGGNGQLGLVRYSKSPIGSYNELIYSPGNYAPGCGAASPLSSIQRIWVDSPYSQAAGRNIWGIPKEMAIFNWAESGGLTSVQITDATTNKVIFQATFAGIPVPQFLVNKAMSLLPGLFPSCMTTLQWPIDDNTGRTPHAGVPAYAIAQKAKATSPMSMLQVQSCFGLQNSVVVKAIGAWADPVAFTGRPFEQLSIRPIGIRLPAGSTAQLPAPTALQC